MLTSAERTWAVSSALSLVEGERRLVAVVPVRDHERSLDAVGRVWIDSPETARDSVQGRLEIGRTRRRLRRRRAVVKQEDRRELRARGLEEAETAPPRLGEAPLVGKHDTALVRLERRTRNKTAARASHSVRADEVLLQQPHRRLFFADENAFLLPSGQEPSRFVGIVGTYQADRVVGTRGE
jgi:hypothetical protein